VAQAQVQALGQARRARPRKEKPGAAHSPLLLLLHPKAAQPAVCLAHALALAVCRALRTHGRAAGVA
jgi:biotin-(acetyl-CoA carboxylase) ligase